MLDGLENASSEMDEAKVCNLFCYLYCLLYNGNFSMFMKLDYDWKHKELGCSTFKRLWMGKYKKTYLSFTGEY